MSSLPDKAHRFPPPTNANTLGSDIYVDIGGWHLFLKDMKVATGVSIALQAKMASGKIEEPDVVDVLKKIPVKARALWLTRAVSVLLFCGYADL